MGPEKGSLFHVIREGIITGRLPPGQRLKATSLAKDHDASPTVVRKALTVLRTTAVGPQISFSVHQLSAEDRADLVKQRILFKSSKRLATPGEDHAALNGNAIPRPLSRCDASRRF